MSTKIANIPTELSAAQIADQSIDVYLVANSLDGLTDYKFKKNTLLQSGGVINVSFLIPSAQVLTANASPVLLIGPRGVGLAIVVVDSSYHIKFNSTPYNTYIFGMLITEGSTAFQAEGIGLQATQNLLGRAVHTGNAGDELQIVENKGLYFKVDAGNPIGGDSDIVIYISYKIIDTTI